MRVEKASPPAGDTLPVLGLAVRHGLSSLRALVEEPFYRLYLRRLRAQALTWKRPRHLGIIMDGNRRFARVSGLPTVLVGHRYGADKLEEVLGWCRDVGISVVTVWSFSLENFQRSAEEVEGLLRLFEDKAREMADSDQVHREEIRVRFIGKLELLPDSLRHEIARVEEATRNYKRFELNIAMAYGGREEITEAVRGWLEAGIAKGQTATELAASLSAADLDPHLYTSGQPEPDLILRTSGEVRSSGFLLWQSAYCEFYFCDTNWPAFREIDFLRALRSFNDRQRRFGV